MSGDLELGRVVRATAPVRVADVGGWTDTWFGSPGQVCNLAVGPGVAVEAALVPARRVSSGPGLPERWAASSVSLPDLGLSYLGLRDEWSATEGRLVDAALWAAAEGVELPDGIAIALEVRSAVPAGASLGTSASVLVAVVGAVDALVQPTARSAAEVAVLAHEVETVRAGREAGVQDQWAAAMGGCSHLAIGPYPEVRHRAVELADETVAELDQRLVTVVFGPHDSSAVHRQVIDDLVACSGEGQDRTRAALRTLGSLAAEAAATLAAGDVHAWAEVLVRPTEAQRHLHPGLVGASHAAAIDLARAVGAVGWKVNGAGGDGGSLTLVAGPDGTGDLRTALAEHDPSWVVLDANVARRGLVVTAT